MLWCSEGAPLPSHAPENKPPGVVPAWLPNMPRPPPVPAPNPAPPRPAPSPSPPGLPNTAEGEGGTKWRAYPAVLLSYTSMSVNLTEGHHQVFTMHTPHACKPLRTARAHSHTLPVACNPMHVEHGKARRSSSWCVHTHIQSRSQRTWLTSVPTELANVHVFTADRMWIFRQNSLGSITGFCMYYCTLYTFLNV